MKGGWGDLPVILSETKNMGFLRFVNNFQCEYHERAKYKKQKSEDGLEGTNMKIIKILLLILILFLGSGCPIFIPLPSEDTYSMRAYERGQKK